MQRMFELSLSILTIVKDPKRGEAYTFPSSKPSTPQLVLRTLNKTEQAAAIPLSQRKNFEFEWACRTVFHFRTSSGPRLGSVQSTRLSLPEISVKSAAHFSASSWVVILTTDTI